MQTSTEHIETFAATGYDVIRLTKSNLKDLARLHSEVYSCPVDLSYFERKYNTAFTGHEYVGLLAYNQNNDPVGYYGVLPCFIEYKGQKILAAQSADTMTHPQHRFKGMFVDLSLKTFELCRQLGIKLVYGFPNQNSYHGAVNRIGWKSTGQMDCFSIPINALPLQKLAGKSALFNRIYSRFAETKMNQLSTPENGFASSAITDGFAAVHRDPSFLSYKSYSPSVVIKLGGAKAWLSKKHTMLVGDFENLTEQNFKPTIKELKKLAATIGVQKIQFHCSPGTELHRIFSNHFLSTPSYHMLFQDFDSPIPPEKIKFTFADIDVF